MRPYCASVYCATVDVSTCDGCRLEAACNAMGIALALAGLCEIVIRQHGSLFGKWPAHNRAEYAARAGIVLP